MILIRKLIHYTPRAYYIENEHSFVIFKTIHLADTFLTFISGLIVLVLTVKKVVFENNGICIRKIRCIKGILLMLNIFLKLYNVVMFNVYKWCSDIGTVSSKQNPNNKKTTNK